MKKTKFEFHCRTLLSKRPKKVWDAINGLLKQNSSEIIADPQKLNSLTILKIYQTTRSNLFKLYLLMTSKKQ